MMRRLILLLLIPLMSHIARGAATEPTTAPAGTVAGLWQRMVEINHRAAGIVNLSADFEQQKFTAMLKHPLISRGTIRVSGSAMRWDTTSPEPTIMRIDPNQVELFYPKQNTLEVYPIDKKLASLAASPLPRLDVLKKYFSFREIPAADLDKDASQTGHLALAMTPIDPALREHVDEVRVLLDASRGIILRAEMVDPDGDRTVIAFSNITTSDGPTESLQIDLPPNVKIVHPLDMIQGKSGGQDP
jgi:outer membrane lipoprotein-sorting protein